jgi:hypothetical protein
VFFNRTQVMQVHGYSLTKWIEKYGIDLEGLEYPCEGCSAMRRPTVPFFKGQLRGVLSAPCSCGHEPDKITPYAVVRDQRFGDILGWQGE